MSAQHRPCLAVELGGEDMCTLRVVLWALGAVLRGSCAEPGSLTLEFSLLHRGGLLACCDSAVLLPGLTCHRWPRQDTGQAMNKQGLPAAVMLVDMHGTALCMISNQEMANCSAAFIDVTSSSCSFCGCPLGTSPDPCQRKPPCETLFVEAVQATGLCP